MSRMPFLFGAQYFRAPTPERECWAGDLMRMKEMGFNCVKYWVQWRWSHRAEDRFFFDDLDELMDLAGEAGLAVHLNVIFDVSPLWLFDKYPDAKQMTAKGHWIEPRAVAHRQIGGAPGPCYNHPGALAERRKFLAAVIGHFKDHRALSMWDIWNEPELSFPVRNPQSYQNGSNMACYCPSCRSGFLEWLRTKYGSLERLNQVWGRCYGEWREVEMPLNGDTCMDFVDWREFHLDSLTNEGNWRLELTGELDPAHVRYLHTVPNTMRVFNSLTGVDDFAMMEASQVYASSGSSLPVQMIQSLSSSHGKVMYNVESHLNGGMLNIHPKINRLPDLLRDWLPQIGMGFRGFLFWQYRPEILGREAPAWGVVNLDGSPCAVTHAAREFGEKMAPHFEPLMGCAAEKPEVGIWMSRKNEIFHYAQHRSFDVLIESVEGYVRILYGNNHPVRFISGGMLESGDLGGIKVLIMPSCYFMTQAEADALKEWVLNGGVLLAEAHLAGYSATEGRHSRVMPGGGLAEAFGLREIETTSSYHLDLETRESFAGHVSDDVKKAVDASGLAGGKYIPVRIPSGGILWGAERFAILDGDGLCVEGTFDDRVCIASKSVGRGHLFYSGTNLGEGAVKGDAGLKSLLAKILTGAGVFPTMNLTSDGDGVHLDRIMDGEEIRYLVLMNKSDVPRTVTMEGRGTFRGIFSGAELDFATGVSTSTLEAGFIDLFAAVPAKNP